MQTLRETDENIRLLQIKFHFVAVLCGSKSKTGEMGSQSHLRKNEYVAQFPSLQVSCDTEAAKNYILHGFLLGLFIFIWQLFLGILLNVKCSFKGGESVKRNWAMRLSPVRVSRP